MAKLTPTGAEQASNVVSGTFNATGQSAWFPAGGAFNIALWGTYVATVALEMSFDGGTTALPACIDAIGDQAIYTTPVTGSVSEREAGMLYRWNCTSYTSGIVNYRMSRGFSSLQARIDSGLMP